MKVFAYKTVEGNPAFEHLADFLSTHGQQGWEFVTSMPMYRGFVFIFKREGRLPDPSNREMP